jgi:hypothetical protein
MWEECMNRTAAERVPWRARWGAAALCLTLLGIAPARADVVSDWNLTAANAGAGAFQLAMLHIAMHDAVNAVTREHKPIAVTVAPPPGPVSIEAAIAEASYRVLAGLGVKAGALNPALLSAQYQAALAAVPAGAGKDNGVAVGGRVAAALLAQRADDGWPYVPVNGVCPAGLGPCPPPPDPVDGSAAGAYRRTPPTQRPLVTPWLGKVRPFVIPTGASFRADGPPALDSTQYAEDYAEVKRLGGVVSERTDEQTRVAIFHTVPPFRFWTSVVRNVAADHHLSLGQHVRFEATVWVAASDALLACWDSKYHFYAWRPYTAIADPVYDDGNPATTPDPTWNSLAPAPPHPEYPSAHSCGAGSITTSLEHWFGTKKLNLRGTGTTVINAPGPTVDRTYPTTTDLAREIVDARVWAGIHFRTADRHGVALGRRVTKYVLRKAFDDDDDDHEGRRECR